MFIILKVYLVSFGLQLLGWPWVKKFFGKLPDKGWSLVRVLISLFAALVVWQLGYLGLPANTTQGVYALLALILLSDIWLVIKNGMKAVSIPREIVKLVTIEEYLFLVGLGVMALIRAHAPSLDSLEKFMDFGFVNQYLQTANLPASDMWQAGMAINYYSFGHFWTSILIRVWEVEPAVGYNMMLAFIFGIGINLAFMASYLLVGRRNARASLVGGLIGAASVLLAGNSHVIWYMVKNGGLKDYWYADATRFIHNTIHEFPGYSFVVSDLHGHLLDLPVILLFLVVLFVWQKNRERIFEVIRGILFGVMMMTNTWDVAVYGLLLLVLGIQLIWNDSTEIKKITKSAIIILTAMFVVAFPWWMKFQSISNGVGVVQMRTPLWQLAVLWGGGVIVSMVAVITEGKKGDNKFLVRTLAVTAVLLILIPELIYAKDIYPNHPRANTMFKLTYQAFIMMGILGGYCWGKLMDREVVMPLVWRIGAITLVWLVFAGIMVYPFEAFGSYYGRFGNYQGLNGEKWMSEEMPENYEAVLYLRKNKDGRNLVEAVGDSYTKLNAVSVYSGVPSIEGWRVHEWLWRGGFGVVSQREAEVTEIYQGDDIEKTRVLLEKYKIGWVLVGQDERIKYKVNEEKLWQLGEMVWKEGETYLLSIY